MMGNSWQTDDQRRFIEARLASYSISRDGGNLKKDFWPKFIEEWFNRWPLPEPPATLVEKKGTVEKATKAWRDQKIEVSVRQRYVF